MAKNSLVSAFDKLPWVVKLILCIPVLNIAWAIYRIIKGASTNNTVMLVVGILWIIPGAVFCWLIDLICTLVWKKPIFIA